MTAALPSSASRSRTKLALMGDDSRPVSVADGKLDVYLLDSSDDLVTSIATTHKQLVAVLV